MQGTNPLTMQCTYSTPCGWCIKWEKKCDKNIGKQSIRPYDYLKEDYANEICQSEEDHQWECCGMSTARSHYSCKKCGTYKTVPHTIPTSTLYEGE